MDITSKTTTLAKDIEIGFTRIFDRIPIWLRWMMIFPATIAIFYVIVPLSLNLYPIITSTDSGISIFYILIVDSFVLILQLLIIHELVPKSKFKVTFIYSSFRFVIAFYLLLKSISLFVNEGYSVSQIFYDFGSNLLFLVICISFVLFANKHRKLKN